MKNTVFIFLFLWSVAIFAQTEKIKIKKEKTKKEKKDKKKSNPYYSFGSFDLTYGQKIFAKNFYSQLNTFDSLNFNKPLRFIGIGLSGHNIAFNPRNNFILKMFWNFTIPEEIKIQDSIKGSLRGFSYNLGWGKALYTKQKKLSVTFYLGFNTGFTKVTSNELGKQLNPFFSPSIAIQPKIVIKRVTISIILDADYDVTNPQWKSFKSTEKSKTIKGLNQTGLSLIGSIGWGLYH